MDARRIDITLHNHNILLYLWIKGNGHPTEDFWHETIISLKKLQFILIIIFHSKSKMSKYYYDYD